MENNTAKNFVLQLGSLVTLYLSISFWIVLLFSLINLLFPDAIDSSWQIESSKDSLKIAIAMLVVFFPTYLLLTKKINTIHRQETNHTYLGLTKWLLYLSLLVGGGVLLGDLVAVILTFLNGEITTRFILKAVVLLVIIGTAFYYYLQETKGYWLSREKQSKRYAILVTILVIGSLLFSFTKVESPSVTRELKLDSTQITDLQNIQWQIESKLSISSSTLPVNLEEAYDSMAIPEAPENREAYTYEVTENGFNLCATFFEDSQNDELMWGPSFDKEALIQNGNNWQYKKGRYCFERVVKK